MGPVSKRSLGAIFPQHWVNCGDSSRAGSKRDVGSCLQHLSFTVTFNSIFFNLFCIRVSAQMTRSSLAFATVKDSVFWGSQKVSHLITVKEINIGTVQMSAYAKFKKLYTADGSSG